MCATTRIGCRTVGGWLLALQRVATAPCGKVSALPDQHIQGIDRTIAELRTSRSVAAEPRIAHADQRPSWPRPSATSPTHRL